MHSVIIEIIVTITTIVFTVIFFASSIATCTHFFSLLQLLLLLRLFTFMVVRIILAIVQCQQPHRCRDYYLTNQDASEYCCAADH